MYAQTQAIEGACNRGSICPLGNLQIGHARTSMEATLADHCFAPQGARQLYWPKLRIRLGPDRAHFPASRESPMLRFIHAAWRHSDVRESGFGSYGGGRPARTW